MAELSNKPSRAWVKLTAPYQNPDVRRSLGQLADSLVPYLALWIAMAWTFKAGLWPLTLLLAVPAAGMLVRLFIVFHDCTHSSFFKDQKWNDRIGLVLGVFTFTPYHSWRRSHAIHHATSGDLDRRGIGDVETMTVREYMNLSWFGRLRYRLYRHPLVLFVVGAPFLFIVINRFPLKSDPERERRGVHLTSLAILVVATVLSALLGWQTYLVVQGSIMLIASILGVWMFYVQHQFEETYWKPHPDWDYFQAAVEGSSFYKLPKVLQWFTGNIGFHHIHHLSSRIPNYALQRCMQENPEFMDVTTITLWSSFKSLRLNLWDEERRELVGFGYVKRMLSQQQRSSSAQT